MIHTSKKELINLFKFLGLKKRSNVLFHTSLIPFGKIEGGVHSIYDCAKKIIGEEGNIIVPSFSYSYRRIKFSMSENSKLSTNWNFSEHIERRQVRTEILIPFFFYLHGP